jgi:hypothetical protein
MAKKWAGRAKFCPLIRPKLAQMLPDPALFWSFSVSTEDQQFGRCGKTFRSWRDEAMIIVLCPSFSSKEEKLVLIMRKRLLFSSVVQLLSDARACDRNAALLFGDRPGASFSRPNPLRWFFLLVSTALDEERPPHSPPFPSFPIIFLSPTTLEREKKAQKSGSITRWISRSLCLV